MRWHVQGLGYFDSIEEAKQAIADSKLTEVITCRVNKKIKTRLSDMARETNSTISDVVKNIIEKEVNNNG